MSKYEDMCEASQAARASAYEWRDRCYNHLGVLVSGLAKYCEIPQEKITYLKWNEATGDDRRYKEPENGRYNIVGAAVFDKEDGYWHLGVSIGLSPANAFPQYSTGFVLCVTEKGQKPFAKIRGEKPVQIDTANPEQLTAFYEAIITKLVRRFQDPGKLASDKPVGFSG